MIPVFLIGGGWLSETFSQTYGCFLQRATLKWQRRIAIVVAEEPEVDSHAQFLHFLEVFETLGLHPNEASKIIVSAKNPLTAAKLAELDPTGIFVCGGLTPAYYEGLCLDRSWLALLRENKIPYGGFSAGAAITSEKAIIGGWQRKINGQSVEITNQSASEDLDFLDVRGGLGLVPFAVDAHATQWGTLSRLIHAVDADLTESGWAIDENTMLEIIEDKVQVHGAGNAYHAKKTEGKILIEIFKQK
jgi:cyanophycinase